MSLKPPERMPNGVEPLEQPSWTRSTHGMRNEILASKQKDERYVPLTCRRYDGKRGRSREKSQASSILCGKKRDPAETGVRKWAGGPSRQGNPGRGRASSSARRQPGEESRVPPDFLLALHAPTAEDRKMALPGRGPEMAGLQFEGGKTR